MHLYREIRKNAGEKIPWCYPYPCMQSARLCLRRPQRRHVRAVPPLRPSRRPRTETRQRGWQGLVDQTNHQVSRMWPRTLRFFLRTVFPERGEREGGLKKSKFCGEKVINAGEIKMHHIALRHSLHRKFDSLGQWVDETLLTRVKAPDSRSEGCSGVYVLAPCWEMEGGSSGIRKVKVRARCEVIGQEGKGALGRWGGGEVGQGKSKGIRREGRKCSCARMGLPVHLVPITLSGSLSSVIKPGPASQPAQSHCHSRWLLAACSIPLQLSSERLYTWDI